MYSKDTRPFYFRQFSLFHHRSTMKVGTDAVLLGIWTPVKGVKEGLDIGTGCGIISLLLASRNNSLHIDAIEIDTDSVEEAQLNFKNSPFAHRLKIMHVDINDYLLSGEKKYDLIVSNPPFFFRDFLPERQGRRLARHVNTLSFNNLIESVTRLMKPEGNFSVVLPYKVRNYFLELSANAGLFLQRQMLIFPRPCKEPNRVNLLLGYNTNTTPVTEKFIIRCENGHFTRQYVDMVKNYYIST